MPPAVADLSVPAVVKRVNWGVLTGAPGTEDGVAIKDGEGTTTGDLCEAEGMDDDNAVRNVDGSAAVNAEGGDGNEADDGDAEESSSAEEGNDEEDSNPDDDDSSLSEDGEDSIAEVKAHVR